MDNFSDHTFWGKLRKQIFNFFSFLFLTISQGCSPFSGTVDEPVSDSYYYSKLKNDVHYSPMGNWFELGNSPLKADVASFKVLARDFGKDKNHLYFKDQIIDSEVDKATFLVKDNFYCFDKNHVYIPADYMPLDLRSEQSGNNQLWKIDKARPETFEVIDSDWAKDGIHFFYNYKAVDVDYSTFVVINEHFAKDSINIYLLKSFEIRRAKNIDPAKVHKIDNRYIADDRFLYDFQEYINGNLADSLNTIAFQSLENLKILQEEYLLIDNKVVYDGFEITDADRATFEIVKAPYTKDKNRVYYSGIVIKDADPQTFEVFEYLIYTKDKNSVYYAGEKLPQADVKTFGPSGDKYSLMYKDKNHTFRGNEIVTED